MKILYYDCFAGISGDMNLAAMIDMGVPKTYLIGELKKLGVEGYIFNSANSIKMGISGTKVNIDLIPVEGGHSHGHHHNNSSHSHSHHRTYKSIKEIIRNSELSDAVKETSIQIFEKVAVAEAKIHSKSVDEVHFHEVGAIDSIVDIVGAAICYHYLKPDKVLCSTVELGGGFVNCAHGKFPVPAPATTEILKGIPVKKGIVNVETTTPTGAAILATLVDEFSDSPNFKIMKTAYGIGHRDIEIPNVLRIHLAESDVNFETEQAQILECNIDDMPAEQFEYLIERLLDAGAHDVYLTPVIMKKSRPATKLSILCSKKTGELLKHIVFTESTTLGIRCYQVEKSMLSRKIIPVQTKYGVIDVKVAIYEGEEIKYKPEYEQCKKLASEKKVPLRVLIDEVLETVKTTKNE